MMRTTFRVSAGAVLALLFAVLTTGLLGTSAAAQGTTVHTAAAPHRFGVTGQLAQREPRAQAYPSVGGVRAAGPATPTGVAPGPGPNINQQIKNADANVAHRKVVVGVAAVVLLVIVYFGHRAQGKHKVKLKRAQSGK